MSDLDCLDCIGGFTITSDPVIGSCVRECTTCQPVCPCCDGQGRYPLWSKNMEEFVGHFNDLGLIPILCHTCTGVVEFKTLDQAPVDVAITVLQPDRRDAYLVPTTRADGTCALCVNTHTITIRRPIGDTTQPDDSDGSLSVPCPLCRQVDFLAHPAIRGRDT